MTNGPNGNATYPKIYGVPLVALERLGALAVVTFIIGIVGYLADKHLVIQEAQNTKRIEQLEDIWGTISVSIKESNDVDKQLVNVFAELNQRIAQIDTIQHTVLQARSNYDELRGRIRAVEMRLGVEEKRPPRSNGP